MGGDEAASVLRASSGRIRLGWRILAFFVVAAVVSTAILLLLPGRLLSQSVAVLLGALVAGWLVLAADGRAPGALGFHVKGSAGRETFAGLALGILVGGLAVLFIAAAGGMRWTAETGSMTTWLWTGAGAIAFLVLPAASEEALMRGYPLQALTESWGPGWALGITSCVFGLAHLANPGVTALAVVNVAAAGLMLGVIYIRTASLWWATGAHLGWNWTHGFAADVSVSGLELWDTPFYEPVIRGPAWLGGGAFGPEGSLVTTAVLLAAATVLWRAKWLRPSEAARSRHPLILARRGA